VAQHGHVVGAVQVIVRRPAPRQPAGHLPAVAGRDQADHGIAGGERQLRLQVSPHKRGWIHSERRRIRDLELSRLLGEKASRSRARPRVTAVGSCSAAESYQSSEIACRSTSLRSGPTRNGHSPVWACAARSRTHDANGSRPGGSGCTIHHADKAYDHRYCRGYLTRRGIKVRIARRGVESSERLGRHRWKAERTIAWLAGYRRLRIRYDRDSERFVAFAMLACDRLCSNRLPCVAIAQLP
jgi:transposase